MNTYLAIVFPVFILMMLGPTVYIVIECHLYGAISIEPALFCGFCFLGVSFIFYMIAIRGRGLEQFYGIGYFDEKGFTIKIPFMRKKHIKYADCKELGIAYYVHGIRDSGEYGCGTYCFYIYFTCGIFDEKYRAHVNRWKLMRNNAKIGFNKELYDYLVSVLPKHQADILRYDYARLNVGKKRKIWENKL